MQHNDALSSQSAVEDPSDTLCTFEANFEQPVTECLRMRRSEISAVNTHFLRVADISRLQSAGKRENLCFDLCTIVLDSVIHDFNHNEIVMLRQVLDHLNPGRYSAPAATLLVAGRCNPEMITAHNRAIAVFLCAMHSYIQFMVGRAGQLSGWPVSVVAGIATPVRLTTHERCNSSGEFSELTTEVAIMATIPTRARTEPDDSDRFYNISRALRHLNKFDFKDSAQHELLEQLRDILTIEKSTLQNRINRELRAALGLNQEGV